MLAEAREIDLAAHKIQTELITAEMSGGEDKPEIGLLMVHAQDHYMTSQLARDLIEELINIFEEKEGNKMKIVLCCAGGFSTTMLMDSMKRTVKESAKLNDDDFSFVAVPVDILNSEVENCDVLVIGPQIAHRLDYIKPIIDPYHIPYVIVDKDTYGKMDGATVLKMALIARKKADMNK